jgi:hypothetical protein
VPIAQLVFSIRLVGELGLVDTAMGAQRITFQVDPGGYGPAGTPHRRRQ